MMPDKRGYPEYGRVHYAGKRWLAHRLVYLLVNGNVPDELDHGCHNTRCVNPAHNRPATHKQNMEHRVGAHRNSRTGVRGVYPIGGGKYRADVGHEGKVIHLGTFTSIDEAAAAAEAKRQELGFWTDQYRMTI
jgi:hypothetical protein